MRSRRRRVIPLAQLPGRAWVQYEPLGVVWCRTVELSTVSGLAPLVAAVAAGNCGWSSRPNWLQRLRRLLARLVPKYVDPRRFRSLRAVPTSTQELLAQGFDHVRLPVREPRSEENHGRRGADPDPGHAGTRRQKSGDRDGRCRHRCSRAAHRIDQANQFRPDLYRTGLRARRRRHS